MLPTCPKALLGTRSCHDGAHHQVVQVLYLVNLTVFKFRECACLEQHVAEAAAAVLPADEILRVYEVCTCPDVISSSSHHRHFTPQHPVEPERAHNP